VWAGLLLVIYVQVWWAMFGLRLHTGWTFPAFLVVLLQTVTLYMIAALVLPESVDERGVDLREHFERHCGWINGSLCATIAVSVVKEELIEGRLPEPANLFVTSASAIVVRRPRYHQALTVVAGAGMGLYIVLLFWQLK
jgi:hypothetical protein